MFALGTGRLYLQKIFLVFIPVRGWVDFRAGRIQSTKICVPTGNRTRDLPACSLVPQPIAITVHRAGPRHVGAQAGKQFGTPSNRYGADEYPSGRVPKIFGQIPSLLEMWFYWHHIPDHASDALATRTAVPLILSLIRSCLFIPAFVTNSEFYPR